LPYVFCLILQLNGKEARNMQTADDNIDAVQKYATLQG
jgi:hypothetical protein